MNVLFGKLGLVFICYCVTGSSTYLPYLQNQAFVRGRSLLQHVSLHIRIFFFTFYC